MSSTLPGTDDWRLGQLRTHAYFTQVRVETDSITESDRTIAERLGEICVSLYTGVEVGPYTKSKVTISGNLHSTVSEKAKKGCAAPKVIAWLLAETWQALIAHTVQTATSRPITGSEGFATSVAFNRHTPKCPQFTFIFRVIHSPQSSICLMSNCGPVSEPEHAPSAPGHQTT